MAKFINPFTDWGFKRIFGQEISKEILIGFLNSLFEGEQVINDLTFLNNEQTPEAYDSRCIIYDVYCTTDRGEHIIVEMQNKYHPHFIDRTIYYAARAVAAQGERGSEWRYDIDAVYAIFFMNFTAPELDHKFRTDVVLADRDTQREFSDKLRLVYLQLPLFKEGEHECDSNFDYWIYTLKNMDILERMPFLAKDAVFRKLAEIADVSTLSREDRRKYDADIKRFRDTIVVMEGAEQLGYEAGMDKGIAEGLSQGRDAERADNIRRLLTYGMSQEQVSAALGVTLENIRTVSEEK